MFGFINIYKPEGMTSFDVVAVLRKITHIKQIGHTGTLDPFATGVLPICIGKSTKLIEYLPDDKKYLATVKFGSNTDTYDKEGQIIQTFDKKVSGDEVENALKIFEGEIEQVPPIYSAIKVNGKKLYQYAREGKDVKIASRKVTIYQINLVEFDYELQVAKILVSCSKGTYIRSLAFDLGKNLNCGGHLISLERIQAGMFNLSDSIKLENINSVEDVIKNLINPLDVLPQKKYVLNDNQKERVSHGLWFKPSNEILTNNDVVFLVYGGRMYGVGITEKDKIKIKKVFEL